MNAPDAIQSAAESLVTREGMRALDAATIGSGIASLDLMERAGYEVARAIVGRSRRALPLLVVAGAGNNGGDGYVIARLAAEMGRSCEVVHIGPTPDPDSDCGINRRRWIDAGGRCSAGASLVGRLAQAGTWRAVVVDCLFGTGLTRPVVGEFAEAVQAICRPHGAQVAAVDLPSGLNADTGEPMGAAVHADFTITIGAAKPGLFVGEGPDYAGEVELVDIGLLSPAEAGVKTIGSFPSALTIDSVLPALARRAHKGTRGHVLVCGGSAGKTGAIVMAARAALRMGAGLVTAAVPEPFAAAVDAALPEAMTLALPSTAEGEAAAGAWAAIQDAGLSFDAAAFGPGMGTGEGSASLVFDAVARFAGPIVMDADALNVLAQDDGAPARLKRRAARGHAPALLTPHPGEMARLCGSTTPEIVNDRLGAVRGLTARLGETVVVLKGAGTIVGRSDWLSVNPTGNPGMGSAGMGDVLAGALAATCARVPSPAQAAVAAVYLHGLAGDLCRSRTGECGFLATEVADRLPRALEQTRRTAMRLRRARNRRGEEGRLPSPDGEDR